MGIKEKFARIYKENISREGALELFDWLENKSDFFTAPASTRFHLSYEGGLVEHSINVYKRLHSLVEAEAEDIKRHITAEKIAIVALLHDVCKANLYVSEMRNTKVGDKWVKVPYYTIDEKFPFGHGEKSVYIINQFLKLTSDEAMAINWHMGGYDKRALGGSSQISGAYGKYPLAVLLHAADLLATYLDEADK